MSFISWTRRRKASAKNTRAPRARRLTGLAAIEALEQRMLMDAGALDPAFGDAGRALTAFNGSAGVGQVAVQTDGKVVAVGGVDGADFALARYNANGSLDESFGIHGKVATEINADGRGAALDVALQADGKIVVAGVTSFGLRGERWGDFAVARYHADGSLDSSFGTGGLVTTGFGSDQQDYAWSVAVEPDGKIVAGGHSGWFPTSTALARYNANGSLDASFGSGGLVLDGSGPLLFGHGMALQPDGKIVMGGSTSAIDFLLKRYNDDGSLDASFGSGGLVTTDFGGRHDSIWSVAVQPDGKIVAAGTTSEVVTTGHGPTDFALARYHANGSLDTSFGGVFGGGRVTTRFHTFSAPRSVVLQPDGKIVMAGSTTPVFDEGTGDGSTQWDVALARYDANGSLDTTFASGGRVITDFGSGAADFASGLALQADGKIVVGGTVGPFDRSFFLVARYLGDEAPAPGSVKFSADSYRVSEGGGIATFTVTRSSGEGRLSLRYASSDGTASAGSDYTAANGVLDFAPGETIRTFTIQVTDDARREGNETVKLSLLGTTSVLDTAVLTIIDNELSPNERYVSQAYLDVLLRPVDDSGLAYWTGRLDGGMPRAEFAHPLTHSAEYYAVNVVSPGYRQFLGREADAGGLAFWVNRLLAGMTTEQVQAEFIGSPEYYATSGGTDREWVRAMYYDLLGRLPDQYGDDYWLRRLVAGGNRSEVAYGFAISSEREGVLVRGYYDRFLGRDPSQAEVDFWVAAFGRGVRQEDVIAGFAVADEYFRQSSRD